MEGIQFVVDDMGEKTAVLIDLKKYGELWEDFYDSLVARLRADEPRESLESVKERLRRAGSRHRCCTASEQSLPIKAVSLFMAGGRFELALNSASYIRSASFRRWESFSLAQEGLGVGLKLVK